MRAKSERYRELGVDYIFRNDIPVGEDANQPIELIPSGIVFMIKTAAFQEENPDGSVNVQLDYDIIDNRDNVSVNEEITQMIGDVFISLIYDSLDMIDESRKSNPEGIVGE